jgi:hypothetical protein
MKAVRDLLSILLFLLTLVLLVVVVPRVRGLSRFT